MTLLLTAGFALLPPPNPLLLAVAQTVRDRQAEADRLFNQGTKQLEQNQNEEAIASFQQALVIYREIKDRKSAGHTLRTIPLH